MLGWLVTHMHRCSSGAMKQLRLRFQPPDILLDVITPITNDHLPITADLRSRLEELSRLHDAALEKNRRPTEQERWEFTHRYEQVIPLLKEQLRDYGVIAETIFPEVFERPAIKR